MDRRLFLSAAAAAAAGLTTFGRAHAQPAAAPAEAQGRGGRGNRLDRIRLAGRTLPELRQHLLQDHEQYLNYFMEHGIDHDNGGFMCFLDHDGTPVNTNKYHWFQGRGVWWMSYLYNHFDKNPRYLEIATKTKDFMLKHYPVEPNGIEWNQVVAKDGSVVTGPSDDPFGCLFGIEGMLELAKATGDTKLRDQALDLYKRKYAELESRPMRHFAHYMLHICLTRFILEEGIGDAQFKEINDNTVDMLMNGFYNKEFGFYADAINPDRSIPEAERNHSNPGHDVEVMWMMMYEAIRRKDQALYDLALERMLRSYELGWDDLYGGMVASIRVGEGAFDWGEQSPVAMPDKYHFIGEYNYMKSLWSTDEALIAMLNAFSNSAAPWAVHYFDRTQDVLDHKLSLKPLGHPLHVVYTDRNFPLPEHTTRKENFHHPRMLMLNIREIDRIIERGGPRRSIA